MRHVHYPDRRIDWNRKKQLQLLEEPWASTLTVAERKHRRTLQRKAARLRRHEQDDVNSYIPNMIEALPICLRAIVLDYIVEFHSEGRSAWVYYPRTPFEIPQELLRNATKDFRETYITSTSFAISEPLRAEDGAKQPVQPPRPHAPKTARGRQYKKSLRYHEKIRHRPMLLVCASS